mmetsp:Transcript_34170/g.60608  ORF Transcript_34170/g.60608 Transcript_34170/m.60608 type:complete len:305 (+) Transcript_34170:65-979(+)
MKHLATGLLALVAPGQAASCVGSLVADKKMCSSLPGDSKCGEFFADAGTTMVQCGLVGNLCLSTGPICEEDLSSTSCMDYYKAGKKTDGVYRVKVKDLDGKEEVVDLYCDMTNGGWTLVGQIQGWHEIYNDWLRKAHNTAQLKTPSITSNGWSSISAVDMAVNHATEIRFSNEDRSKWVKWALDADRKVSTLWKQSAGRSVINSSPNHPVTVYDQDGGTSNCNQNEYGIMDWSSHGGAYPAATRNDAGNTSPNDDCMSIGVMLGKSANGFSHRQGGNGFDAPESNSDWPNRDYNSAPMVSIWLK